MIIDFQLEYMDKEQKELIPEFLDEIVYSMKADIRGNLRMSKIMCREEDLLTASWIQWTRKVTRINMKSLCYFIINQLKWKKKSLAKESYIIGIDKSAKMLGTKTSVEKIARFLDRGNNVCPGTHFLNKTFIKYRKNMNDYWKSFISIRLGVVVVNECISIR